MVVQICKVHFSGLLGHRTSLLGWATEVGDMLSWCTYATLREDFLPDVERSLS